MFTRRYHGQWRRIVDAALTGSCPGGAFGRSLPIRARIRLPQSDGAMRTRPTEGAENAKRQTRDRGGRRPDGGDQSIAGRRRARSAPVSSDRADLRRALRRARHRRRGFRRPFRSKAAPTSKRSPTRRPRPSARRETSRISPIAGISSLRSRPTASAWFLYIGGNDTAETVRIVSEEAAKERYDLRCLHIPKTIDNDLMENDHAPGFPSAARFVAEAVYGSGPRRSRAAGRLPRRSDGPPVRIPDRRLGGRAHG